MFFFKFGKKIKPTIVVKAIEEANKIVKKVRHFSYDFSYGRVVKSLFQVLQGGQDF
jgi:hypothetical protein